MKDLLIFTFVLILGVAVSSCKEPENADIIIPMPVSIEHQSGHFTLHSDDAITYDGCDGVSGVADYLGHFLRKSTGYGLEITEGAWGVITLVLDSAARMQPEEYRLVVTRKKVTLTAGTPAGLFRGVQTLRQLLPPQIEAAEPVQGIKWTMPCVEINDYPRFIWRGMHLDVSRHFFDVEFVKRYIDLIALHKMNTFHWHLVDDQGWRIEIKKYPELTETGAWRADHEDMPWSNRPGQKPGEKATYGGFYTQEQIREVVAYAAERHINVVPEIEMPAHVGSVLAAYPQYSCTGGPFTVPTGGVWPITDIYCAGRDETFSFIEDILTEVMDLFPSPYIHIGGDEADKTEWKKCKLCQARIRKEGLKDEAELQSYFIKRIERFVSSKGRHLIGWDEILEGGLAPGAAVMSWRGFQGGIEAARSGHYVVMTPVSHCYFDYYQADPSTEPLAFGGYTTLKKVYSFEPVPAELTPEEAKFVLGAQANLWTEMIRTGSHAEYMVLPRMTALSEVLWSPAALRDWASFTDRLPSMTERFDVMGINYSHGTFRVEMETVFDTVSKSVMVKLLSEQPDPVIRYTTDGSDPSLSSPVYDSPVTISDRTTIKAAVFRDDILMGKISEKEMLVNKATGCPVKYNTLYHPKYQANKEVTLVDGIFGSKSFNDGHWQGFEGTDMDVVIDLGEEMPVTCVTAGFIANTGSWIFLPQWVEYSVSSDGSTFNVVDRQVIDTDPAEQVTGRIDVRSVPLQARGRYVRVLAGSLGTCPPWHAGAGGKAWLFSDEIIID